MYNSPAKEGEIKVFNNNGNAEAYCYKNNKWEKIGDVLGTKQNKHYYSGDKHFAKGEYDYIFDVELDGQTFKLPFNKGDNCLLAAEKFVNRENLHRAYVDDVTKFLRANTQQQSSFKPAEKKQQPSKSNLPNIKVSFPRVIFNIYDSINVEGPFKKIGEINTNLDPSIQLLSHQIKHLELLLDKIKKVQFYHSTTFTDQEINLLLNTLSSWPLEHNIPFLDILRMFVLAPKSQESIRKSGVGSLMLNNLLKIFENGNEIQKILVLRIFNNMFVNELYRHVILEKRQDILASTSSVIDSTNRNIRGSFAGLLYK
jgi:hypothetical protein